MCACMSVYGGSLLPDDVGGRVTMPFSLVILLLSVVTPST